MKRPVIDIGLIDTTGLKKRPFGGGARFRIWVTKEAHESVWRHADETAHLENEVGGILLGQVLVDEEGPYLEVSAALVARHTQNEGTQVTFTFETWEAIHADKERDYPDAKIVGWYHTHPRFGIFLSRKDVFIQQGFFNHPWQTAFVVDPVARTEGFFYWKEGEPVLSDDYWVDGTRRGVASAEARKSDESNQEIVESDPPRVRSKFGEGVLPWVLVAMIGVFAGQIYLRDAGRATTELQALQLIEVARLDALAARHHVEVVRAAPSLTSEDRGHLDATALYLDRAVLLVLAIERAFGAVPAGESDLHPATSPEGGDPAASAVPQSEANPPATEGSNEGISE